MKRISLPSSWLARITLLIGFLLAIWLMMSGVLYYQSQSIIFRPERSFSVITDVEHDQQYIQLTEDPAEMIDLWVFDNPDSDLAILYLHGNSGRIPTFFDELSSKGDLFSPAYPGFHTSSGSLSQATVLQTAEASLDYVRDQGYSDDRIVVLGHSLGGSPAMYLASKNPELRRVITLNTFSSIYSMCTRNYGPFCIFGTGIFPSTQYAAEATGTVDVYHVKNDLTIPSEESQKLFDSIASDQKTLTFLSQWNHNAVDFDEITF